MKQQKITVTFHNEPNMKLVKEAVKQYLKNEEVRKVLLGGDVKCQ